jgi:hypothetical protein
MIRRSVALMSLTLILGPTLVGAAMMSTPSGIDGRLRFEWAVSQSPSGRPVIGGYLYNDYTLTANNVILLIEALDASGRVVERAIRILPDIVPVLGRTYFEVPLKAGGANYRISMTSFQWLRGGS